MLNDIFYTRYSSITIWDKFTDVEEKFINQVFSLVSEDLCPDIVDGKANDFAKKYWLSIHNSLTRELGLKELSPKRFLAPGNQLIEINMGSVCKTFMLKEFQESNIPDHFMKERLSLIELAFREKDAHLNKMKKFASNSPHLAALVDKSVASIRKDLDKFKIHVEELNERLKTSGYALNYHNGFIQISKDKLIEENIETEFWALTRDQKWKNVDFDMKSALDLRDSGGEDPAFPAAKALESTLKIISNEKGWTTGKERGAGAYINHFMSKKNGQFISNWEGEQLLWLFSNARNPFGHGPGSEEMTKFNPQQIDWAIETCMSWIKSLIKRM
ncbi:MAG: hypothetical protein ACI92E_001333 [Oceanicoccus sp.]|jgi:hypothetical protein